MALDAATLALTAAELKTTLADAKIAKLFEPTRDELVITLRTRTETDSLLLSARWSAARPHGAPLTENICWPTS